MQVNRVILLLFSAMLGNIPAGIVSGEVLSRCKNSSSNVDDPANLFAEPDFVKCSEMPDQFVCSSRYLECREEGKEYFQCYDLFYEEYRSGRMRTP